VPDGHARCSDRGREVSLDLVTCRSTPNTVAEHAPARRHLPSEATETRARNRPPVSSCGGTEFVGNSTSGIYAARQCQRQRRHQTPANRGVAQTCRVAGARLVDARCKTRRKTTGDSLPHARRVAEARTDGRIDCMHSGFALPVDDPSRSLH